MLTSCALLPASLSPRGADAVADVHDFLKSQEEKVKKKGFLMLGETKANAHNSP